MVIHSKQIFLTLIFIANKYGWLFMVHLRVENLERCFEIPMKRLVEDSQEAKEGLMNCRRISIVITIIMRM